MSVLEIMYIACLQFFAYSTFSECGYDLLDDVESEIQKNQLRGEAKVSYSQDIEEENQVIFN